MYSIIIIWLSIAARTWLPDSNQFDWFIGFLATRYSDELARSQLA